MYIFHLWNNFLSSSSKRTRVAYNNSFRFLHGLHIGSDGIQGVRTGSREPVLRISARLANPV